MGEEDLIKSVADEVISRLRNEGVASANTYKPNPDVLRLDASEPFMQYSTPRYIDFLHPTFASFLEEFDHHFMLHRKLWEWVFILHHAVETAAIGPGQRAVGFGVGGELTPAVLAERGTLVHATDAPTALGEAAGWRAGGQLADGLANLPSGRLQRDAFQKLVSFSECDMNAIDPALQDFDFCWSACAFEHLGTLRKGMDFVINSVENTLRVGGVAVHTTELNLSSNEDTVESGWCAIYRRRDLEALIEELRDRGHVVQDLRIASDSFHADNYVDVPPYRHDPHLKLLLQGFVTTSVGLVIRRGR